jgi:hypothetical protein
MSKLSRERVEYSGYLGVHNCYTTNLGMTESSDQKPIEDGKSI